MRRESHVRFCESVGVKLPHATHLIVGFEHEGDARRFLDAMRERFEAFSLSIHPDKTLCVPKTKSERIDDEVRPGWRANL